MILVGASGLDAEIPFSLYDDTTGAEIVSHTFIVGDVKIRLPGGAWANADKNNIVEWGNGQYGLKLTATETATVGKVGVRAKTAASSLDVKFDAIEQPAVSALDSGTAQAGGNSTITLRIGASALDGAYADGIIVLMSSTGAMQMNQILSYVGASKVATLARAWTTNPDATSTYSIYPGSSSPSGMATAVWAAIGEGAHTYGDLVRAITSGLVCKVTDFTTGTLAFKSVNGAKTRFTVTVNATGRLSLTIGDLTP